VIFMREEIFDEDKQRRLIVDLIYKQARIHDDKQVMHLQPDMEVVEAEKSPFIVALGPSPGGLQPLQKIVNTLSGKADIAIIVIQHFSPETETMMDKILQRETEMRVCAAADGMRVEAGCVFVIPPGENLEVASGRFHLSKQQRLPRGPQYPIDICFRSVARESHAV